MKRAESTRSVRAEEYELELGGHLVHPGSKVNARWKGIWYDGVIAKIGPSYQPMCRVREMSSNQTLLLEEEELKLMEPLVVLNQLSPGTRVAFNDGDTWAEGVVEESNCIGAALVRWRESIHQMENENWFEMSDLAPVIDNEAYLAANEDLLVAGKSGLLQHDPIDPRPLQRENVLYQSDDSEPEVFSSPSPKRNREEEPFYHVLDENYPPQHRIALTSSSTLPKKSNSNNNTGQKKRQQSNKPSRSSQSHTLDKNQHKRRHASLQEYSYPHPHSFTLPHPHAHTLPHPHTYTYLAPPPMPYPAYPYIPGPPPLSPVKLPPTKTLEHTSLPVAWSYTAHYSNGVPPHATSSFFTPIWSAPTRNRSKVMPRKLSSPSTGFGILKKSPSNVSKAASEPLFSSTLPPHLATVEVMPKRTGSSKSLLSWRKSKDPSPKKHREILTSLTELSLEEEKGEKEPEPYEVPINIYEEIDNKTPPINRKKESKKGKMKKSTSNSKLAKESKDKSVPEKALSESKEKVKKPAKEKSSLKSKTKSPDKNSAKALTIASSSPPEVGVVNGSSALLTCLASGREKVTYQWSKEGVNLPSKAHPNLVVKAPGIMEVQKCTTKDNGLYICTVSNKWGTGTRTFQLTVSEESSRSPVTPPERGGGLFPHSPQVATPVGGAGEVSLHSSFNNKVTLQELGPSGPSPGEGGDLEPETVQAFLDSLVEEIHISDDEFGLWDTEQAAGEQLPERPPGDGKESSTHPPHSRDKTEFIPRIIVTEPTKSLRAKRQQISDPIKDDNEDYLEGYGIDYGAISSTTDLEKEGLSKYAEKDIAKKLKEKRKRIKKLNEQSKKPQKEKKKFSLFSRSKKKSKDKEQDEHILDYTELPSPSKSSVRFADILEEEIRKRESVISDVNSVGVNTSLGSDHTDTSILERGGATEGLQLPTEEESISEQVRRLQASVDQYNQEKQGNKKTKKSKVFGKKAKT